MINDLSDQFVCLNVERYRSEDLRDRLVERDFETIFFSSCDAKH